MANEAQTGADGIEDCHTAGGSSSGVLRQAK